MSDRSGIEWTDATWNPVTGCTEVSPGCDHCYAKTFAERFRGTEGHYFENGFDVQLRPEKLDLPLRWRKPRRIFVNSMSDLFHDDVPTDFIAKVFAIMSLASQHTYQVLTKRHGRMRTLLNSDDFEAEIVGHAVWFADHWYAWPEGKRVLLDFPLRNVQVGVSAENRQWAKTRGDALRDTRAAVRFFSCEPLLNAIPDLDLTGIDWVIVGGESGHRARPMNPRWVRSIRDQCLAADVPFLFKQWGEWGPAPWKIERQPDEFTLDYKKRAESEGATHAFTGGMYNDLNGAVVEHFRELTHAPWSIERAPEAPKAAEGMRRWGKKVAGRQLDGRTWDEHPQAVTRV